METLLQDLSYAARTFRKSPGFSAVALLTLGLGIGATTAMFSVLDGILLKPLPYVQSGQLVSVNLNPLGLNSNRRVMAPELYWVFREQTRTFQDIGIYAETDTDRDVNVTGFSEPERVHAVHVSDSVLTVLGVEPMLGRVFSHSDDTPSAAPTVVLTHAYWQRKFGAQQSALGKTLIVDGEAREIIGVMPREFRFLDAQNLMLILPLQLQRSTIYQGNLSYFGIARLREGATLETATADVSRMLPIAYRQFPPGPGMPADVFQRLRLSPSLLPLKQQVVGNIATMLWVLMGGVGIVLLIACANVTNLLLVRTSGRDQELALRAALGARRKRIVRQLLNEAIFLGLLGGVCGLAVAWAVLRIAVRLAPSGLPRISDIAIDVPALAFTLSTSLLASLLFGLIPVFKYVPISGRISPDTRSSTSNWEQHRVQNTLASLQVALAVVLLVCSGLLIRTFLALSRVNPGYVPAEVQTFRVSISPSDVADNEAVLRLEQGIQDQLTRISGVSAVAIGSSVPMDGYRAPQDNVLADTPEMDKQPIPPPRRDMFVSPGYMQALRISLLAGRDFNWGETYKVLPVALVSESFAREYWHSPDAALGKRVKPRWSSDWREIIGVVADVQTDGVDQPARSTVYWPMLTSAGGGTRVSRFVTFAVCSPLAGSQDFTDQVSKALWSVNSKLALANVGTLDYFYSRSMARTSFTLILLTFAGGIALVLGSIGLYGVMSYSVSRRTREIGIRMALGASPRSVLTLILARAMALIVAGLALGVIAALLLTRLLSSMLFGVHHADPLTYILVVLLLGLVALAACYLPAWRAARVDPIIALRYE